MKKIGILENLNNKLNLFIEKNKYLFIILLFVPHVCHITLPYGSISIIDYLLVRYTLLSTIILFYIYFFIKKKKPSVLLIVMTLSCIWLITSTLINNPIKTNKAILYLCSSVSIAMIIEIFIDDIKVLIRALLICFEVQIYPNLITVLLFHSIDPKLPGYNNNRLLLGTKNDLILYLLPAFCLSIMYFFMVKKSFRPICLTCCILLTLVFSESTTTLISFICFCGIALYCIFIKKNKIKKPLLLFIIPISFFVIVVLPYVCFGENIIVDFIMNNIYYKHSFEARTLLWIDSKKYILDKPIMGYGFYNDSIMLFDNDLEIHSIAHNTLIQKALNGGLIELVLFCLFFVLLIIKITRFKNCTLKYLFISLLCGILVAFISQDYHRLFELNIIFYLIYHIEEIQDNSTF